LAKRATSSRFFARKKTTTAELVSENDEFLSGRREFVIFSEENAPREEFPPIF